MKLCPNRMVLMGITTVITFYMHRLNPELMQILLDSGTFVGVVFMAIEMEKDK